MTSKAWYSLNKARHLAYCKQWALNNPDKIRANRRAWKQRNPDRVLAEVNKRRARVQNANCDGSAERFYSFVRSQKSIPCYYCGEPVSGNEAHIDHVIAISKSGNHASDNLCASCPKCNMSKHDHDVSEWSRKKLDQPLLNL